jgi:hypothetical protein
MAFHAISLSQMGILKLMKNYEVLLELTAGRLWDPAV